jgi:hypothetical protein
LLAADVSGLHSLANSSVAASESRQDPLAHRSRRSLRGDAQRRRRIIVRHSNIGQKAFPCSCRTERRESFDAHWRNLAGRINECVHVLCLCRIDDDWQDRPRTSTARVFRSHAIIIDLDRYLYWLHDRWTYSRTLGWRHALLFRSAAQWCRRLCGTVARVACVKMTGTSARRRRADFLRPSATGR